jgi:hypothetical protein
LPSYYSSPFFISLQLGCGLKTELKVEQEVEKEVEAEEVPEEIPRVKRPLIGPYQMTVKGRRGIFLDKFSWTMARNPGSR